MGTTMPRSLSPLLVLLTASGPACAQQWTAVVLHPPSMRSSEVTAISATHQGGIVTPPSGWIQAALWYGTAESWTPLTPDGQLASLNGMDQTRQVGNWQFPNVGTHAILWQGTPASAVDLHPEGFASSGAGGVSGAVQSGSVTTVAPVVTRAALWRGTPWSFVDLHPASASESSAGRTDGVLQGGYARFGSSIPQATLWSGTPQSCVVLSTSWSEVRGMAAGVQVGYVTLANRDRAAVWRGSAESFVDLTPPGWAMRLHATTGRLHVGDGGFSTLAGPWINFGTVDSWLDLRQFLPPPYTSFASARAVYQDGDRVYVGGWATNPASGLHEAILWIGAVPCYANCDGSTAAPTLNVGDFTCFLQRFSAGDGYANCDRSTQAPTLNVADFTCFLQKFAAGCP
jgi:hypothetical protein